MRRILIAFAVVAVGLLSVPATASAHGCTVSAGVVQLQNVIVGTNRADTINCSGVNHGHVILAGPGNDTVTGSATATDLIMGQGGNDQLDGNLRRTMALGGPGTDTCHAAFVLQCETAAGPDTDGDGVPDAADTDDDNDGSTDVQETACGSDPLDGSSTCEVCDGADNDVDGSVDEGFTDTNGDAEADCVDADDDGDGLLDGDEATLGTDPLRSDTDGDQVSDSSEVACGSDPLDAASTCGSSGGGSE
jgi:hypothetical protein